MNRLLIVESPAKAKTIGKYLKNGFTVKSSVGHIRDLPKKGGLAIKISPVKGVEGSWKFEPSYEITPEKKKVVSELRAAAKAADEIYLAPDPDREGEAIAWHLQQVLAKETKGKKVARVTYNEITESAVRDAVENPREINLSRVDAQQARRILDRLVGFKVSPMLWKYLPHGRNLSAGRVQSVALRLLVEREREIRAFKPEPYWVFGVEAKKDNSLFAAKLSRIDGDKPAVKDEGAAKDVVSDLEGASLRVSEVKDRPKTRHPYPPFTTSTLQQAASSVCGFSPHRTMGLAQKLYESGLITYMRTDSVNISQTARSAASEFISAKYGQEFLPEKPNFYKSKAGAQEAHEAIRPTDIAKEPGSVSGLDSACAKLYDLVWRRFVASQMCDAKLSLRTVTIVPEKKELKHGYVFTASTTAVVFEGFLKVMPSLSLKKKAEESEDGDSDEVGSLPPLAQGDRPELIRWLSERKETKPPSRFSEAALVKALEENGVGRPSTYAQTIEVLVTRKYVTRDARQLLPTKCGEDVNDWLVKRMPALFDVGYTALMEDELDKVEADSETGAKMLSRFYSSFLGWLEGAKEPPPSPSEFEGLFELLSEVKQWRKEEPPKDGKKRRYPGDEAFVASVKEQAVNEPEKLSRRQLDALAAMCLRYSSQISDAENRLSSFGWSELVEKAHNAPPSDLMEACFTVLQKAGVIGTNAFADSLHAQFARKGTLSEKQFAILARMTLENVAEGDDGIVDALKPYAPAAGTASAPDPALPELMAMLDDVSEWREPVKRGKRVFDDKEFAESLKTQYAQRKMLTSRQVYALKKMLVSYREKISAFDERAAKVGISLRAGASKKKGGKSRRS